MSVQNKKYSYIFNNHHDTYHYTYNFFHLMEIMSYKFVLFAFIP